VLRHAILDRWQGAGDARLAQSGAAARRDYWECGLGGVRRRRGWRPDHGGGLLWSVRKRAVNFELSRCRKVDNLCYVKLKLGPFASRKVPHRRSSCMWASMWTILHMFSNMEMRMGKTLEVRTRKSTNVTLPLEVLDRAKELGINLSRASERGVREEIQETEARRWADDNSDLVAAYTSMVERDGLPLANYRTF
jgi:antitoxin CcdA